MPVRSISLWKLIESKSFLAGRFEQSRTQLAMYLNRASDDLFRQVCVKARVHRNRRLCVS